MIQGEWTCGTSGVIWWIGEWNDAIKQLLASSNHSVGWGQTVEDILVRLKVGDKIAFMDNGFCGLVKEKRGDTMQDFTMVVLQPLIPLTHKIGRLAIG